MVYVQTSETLDDDCEQPSWEHGAAPRSWRVRDGGPDDDTAPPLLDCNRTGLGDSPYPTTTTQASFRPFGTGLLSDCRLPCTAICPFTRRGSLRRRNTKSE